MQSFAREIPTNLFRKRVDSLLNPARSDEHSNAFFTPGLILSFCNFASAIRLPRLQSRDFTPPMFVRQSSSCHSPVAKHSCARKTSPLACARVCGGMFRVRAAIAIGEPSACNFFHRPWLCLQLVPVIEVKPLAEVPYAVLTTVRVGQSL